MKLTKKEYSRLARCVVGALVFMGGGTAAHLPIAAAQEIEVTTNLNSNVYGNAANTNNPIGYNASNYSNNVLTLKEGASVLAAYGAYSNVNTQQAISNNIVNIYAGSTNTGVTGGAAYGAFNSIGNTINVYGGTTGYVIGGSTGGSSVGTGIAQGNLVTIHDGTINGAVQGGHSGWGGNAISNTVTINGGTIAGTVAGGDSTTNASGGDAIDNIVNVNGGTMNQTVYGGFVYTGTASGNVVNIKGGTINADVVGGASSAHNAINNTVNITGGLIKGNVMGGNNGSTGEVSNNTVNIYAVEDIEGGIYGGMSTGGGTISKNIINILGTINISGYLDGYETNTINVASINNHVGALLSGEGGHLSNMNFFLPSNTKAGDTMLTVDGTYQWYEGYTNLKNVTFGVAAQSGLSLNVGDKVKLIYDANGITTDSTLKITPNLTVPTGISTDTTYGFSIEKDGTTAITTTVTSKSSSGGDSGSEGGTLPERTKSLTETRAGMASLLNNGTDLLTSQGFEQADVAASQGNNANGSAVAGGSFAPFAALGGSSLKVKSGSHVDNKAFGINLGFAKKFENRQGTLLFGPIFEYGHGSYDSYLNNGVHGWGNSSYFGGGLFAKQKNHDGLYYEGSLRAGRMKADYSGNLATGLNANYDTSSTYFAAHLGIGKVFAIKNGDNVDTYLKYFYSRTGSDDVTIHSNLNDERYHFDSVTSNRIRLGFRYNHPLNDKSKLYAGLAWQYEFDGEARATYNGMSTPTPSLKGSSGMAELGWQVKPGNAPLTLDLGVTGWAGKQQGVTASLKMNWEF